MADPCCSYDLSSQEQVPTAFLVRLPQAVCAALRSRSRRQRDVSSTVRLHPEKKEGVLRIGGQEYLMRGTGLATSWNVICHPEGQAGQAADVGCANMKWQVQSQLSTPAGRQAGKARAGKGGSLAEKAALIEKQREQEKRERESNRHQHSLDSIPAPVAGKTTAPERFRFTTMSKGPSPAVQGSVLPPVAKAPHPPQATARHEEAHVPVPKEPTQEMRDAATRDGVRGCIIALLNPVNMRVKPKPMEKLVQETFRQLQKKVPDTKAIGEVRHKVCNYQQPGVYILKEEVRRELAGRGTHVASSPARGHQEGSTAPPGSVAADGVADTTLKKISGRKRPLAPGAKAVWAPGGDAASRLAAVPSTAAAERAEREAREAVLRGQTSAAASEKEAQVTGAPAEGRGAKHRPVTVGNGKLLGDRLSKRPRAEAVGPSGSPGQLAGGSTLPAPGRRVTRQRSLSDMGGELLEQMDRSFFQDHVDRPTKSYGPVVSEEQAQQYKEEFNSKYPVLLSLNKQIGIHKQKAKEEKGNGAEGEAYIRQLWERKGSYLQAMDAAYRKLSKELSQMKDCAKAYYSKAKQQHRT